MTRALAAVPVTPSEKDEPRDRGTIAWRVFVALVLIVIAVAVYFTRQGTSAEDDNTRLLNLINTECGPGGASVGQPLCVITAPQRAEDTSQAAAAVGVDAAQVIEIVRAELAANPTQDGRTPTTDELTALIRGVFAQNPQLYRGDKGEQGLQGAPGEGPSDAQVQAAAAAVIAADPEAFRGPAGPPGQSPACLSEPNQCKGADGRPPVQITQKYADGSSTVCTRDDASTDTAPTYTCPPPTGATTTPEPPSGADPPANPDPAPDPATPSMSPTPGDGGLFGG